MAWELIESQTLGSSASSVTFSSGLSSYKFFRVSAYVVNDGTGNNEVLLRFNGSSATDYDVQEVEAASTTVQGTRSTGQTSIELTGVQNFAASQAGSLTAVVAKPSSSVKAHAVSRAGYNTSPVLALNGGEWDNTSNSITSLSILPSAGNFAAGTSVLLEGLAD